MHTGRHRYRTHAGIPHGSTVNAGTDLEICYLWKQAVTYAGAEHTTEEDESATVNLVSLWRDSGANGNNASQETDEVKPVYQSDGGIDFQNKGDNASYADEMEFTKFNTAANTDFISFIVCSLGNVATSCYLSDGGAEVLQYTSATQHQFKTSSTSNMTHGGGTVSGGSLFQHTADEKHLMVVHRTNGSTGTMKIYKNGIVCNGHNNNGTTNANAFDLKWLGAKNSASNWFDGVMYDVIFINGNSATDRNRELITNYLLTKHGIEFQSNSDA
tara:strand:+ start:2246 stop:3061 length:816 start_codon:yes stop_codon:yes gene_type:complete